MSETPIKGNVYDDDFVTPHRKLPRLRRPKALEFGCAFDTPSGSTPGISNRSDDSGLGSDGTLNKRIAKVSPMPHARIVSAPSESPANMVQRPRQGLERVDHPPPRNPKRVTIPMTPHFMLPARSRPLPRLPSPPRIHRTPPMSPNTRKSIIEAVVERLYKPKYRQDLPKKI